MVAQPEDPSRPTAVTITVTGNTDLGDVDIPSEWSQIRFFTDTPGSTTARATQNATFNAVAIGGNNGTSMILNDVRINFTGNQYSYIGNFTEREHTTALTPFYPTYNWNNVQIEGDVNDLSVGNTVDAQVFFNVFSGAVDNSSQFNNVSFWNNVDLTAPETTRGGTWQTTTNATYSNILFGPFGTALNQTRNTTSRMIARYANQGRGDLTPSNHAGLVSNLDFRSLQQINIATLGTSANNLDWFIDVDSNANVYFMNWLPGNPAARRTYTFSNIFNGNIVNLTAESTAGRPATGTFVLTFPPANDITDAARDYIVAQTPTGTRRMEFWAGRDGGTGPIMRYSINSTADINPVADGTLANRVNIPLTGNTETGALPSPNTINHIRCFNENNVEIALIALTQVGAQAHVCTATNQLPNTSFDTVDNNHIYTFTETQIDTGVYDLITPWSITAQPRRIGSRVHTHNGNALMFRQLHFDQVGNRNTAPDSNPRTYSTNIPAPSTQTYRKYSWRQQTNNYSASTFGNKSW